MKFSITIRVGIAAAMICVILVVGGSRTAETAGDADRPIAVIGSFNITEKAFKAEMEKGGSGLPGRFEKPEQRETLLEDMVRFEVLYANAINAGYDKKPAILDALKRVIVNQYRQDHLEPELAKITVTDDEIRLFYNEHTSEFSTPQMVRAAVIKISVPAKAPDEKRTELLKRAEYARAEAMALDRATLSFGQVAIKFSDDQMSRYRGGDTGLMKRGASDVRWGKEVMDAIFSLKEPGQVSSVIVSSDGYYIVKLMETKAGVTRPFFDVKEIIQSRLFFEKKIHKEKEFYEKLASALKIEINRELLSKIELPNAGGSSAPPAVPR
ncbi:MAG: peptidyl-prolyl cis-trans isomerase [Nitrospirae bacterium]|nr:peptidyl-prolyl cis-trans isomerase [Nitrospirota bacterium]